MPPRSHQKLKFSSEESLEVLRCVKWSVYAEVLSGDGDVLACTPHPLMDRELHRLHVSSRYVHNARDPLSPYTHIFDVQVAHDDADDDSDDEERQLVFAGVGKGDTVVATMRGVPASPSASASASVPDDYDEWQIEWSSGLRADAHEHVPYERTGEANVWSMDMMTHGYCSVVSLFKAPGTGWPRKWCGIQLKVNAVGVARALHEAEVEVDV